MARIQDSEILDPQTSDRRIRDLRILDPADRARPQRWGVSSSVLCTIFRVTSRLERWCLDHPLTPPHRRGRARLARIQDPEISILRSEAVRKSDSEKNGHFGVPRPRTVGGLRRRPMQHLPPRFATRKMVHSTLDESPASRRTRPQKMAKKRS